MRDKLEEAIRFGIVSSIDYEKCTAQVTFKDREDIVSRDLPVLQPKTCKDRYYYMPDIGERVVCLFDPTAPSRAFIIGSYYDDTRLPPITDENNAYVKFEDETLVEYHRKEHKLKIHVPKAGAVSIEIITQGNINITSSSNVNITGSTINLN